MRAYTALTKAKVNAILKAMKINLYKYALHLLYPLKCQICKAKLEVENTRHICIHCRRKIKINLPPFCLKCGKSRTQGLSDTTCRECKENRYLFDRAWAVSIYEGVIKECLLLFKYRKKRRLLKLFSELACNFMERFIDYQPIDLISAVPLSKNKMRQREFNQSGLLAREIGGEFKKTVLNDNLIKIKDTPSQVTLSGAKRRLNLTGAFKAKEPRLFKDKNILLIDDVFTTGSTLNECSEVLKKAGAKKVYALALARGS